MRRSPRAAALAAALVTLTGTGGAVAGEARSSLAVTVRVVDSCQATATAAAATQSCGSRAQVRREPGTAARPTGPAGPVEQAAGLAAVAAAGFVTVIY